MTEATMVYGKDLIVEFDFSNLNIHIENSFKVKSKKEIRSIVNDLILMSPFQRILKLGFTRTKSSLIREWAAHNFLYEHNYKRERTKDIDLNQTESLLRRLGYFFLSLFYK